MAITWTTTHIASNGFVSAGGSGPGGTGTDNNLVRWDGVSDIQDSGIAIDDSDNLSHPGQYSQKVHSAFTGSDLVRFTAALQTADDTETTLATVSLSDNSVYIVEAFVVAREDSGGVERAVYVLRAAAHRESGTSTLDDATDEFTYESDPDLSAIIDVDDGADELRIRITGLPATDINWTCTVTYQAVSDDL